MSKSVLIVGAGIAGLAMAYASAIRGHKVIVLEKEPRAIGASVRNFGMVWPIGQPKHDLFEIALNSRRIWMELCKEAGIWNDPCGSLHLAYEPDEWNVLMELEKEFAYNKCQLLSPKETILKNPFVNSEGLAGSLFSASELIIDPREAIRKLPVLLHEKYGVVFHWSRTVTDIRPGKIFCSKEEFNSDYIFICNGADFNSLYPDQFAKLEITKCKLQMMRMKMNPSGKMGPALCGPLSLLHYKSFTAAASLSKMKERYEQQYAEYLKWGIHVMVSQHENGELTIGDSHEYALVHDPFDKELINQLILDYLKKFSRFPGLELVESWNGIYPKLTNGESFLIQDMDQNVKLFNGLGGAGMTLSFGLADRLMASLS